MAILSYQEKLDVMTRKQKEIAEAKTKNDLQKFLEILGEGKSAVGIRPAWRILIDGKPVFENITNFDG